MRLMAGLTALLVAGALSGCAVVAPPPKNIDNICAIFESKPFWYRTALQVEERWNIPIPVMMAFIHQESAFRRRAKPPRRKILWIIPGPRLSDAVGYAQAIDSSWKMYREDTDKSILTRRSRFPHAIDFVGWYNHQSVERLKIAPSDAYNLYLAYHEGWGGYERRSWLEKLWLSPVARKVAKRAGDYQRQLSGCAAQLPTSHWLLRPQHWFSR